MHFDDRLATVLRLPARGDAVARSQFRQLVDLLGTCPADAQGPRIDAAFLRLADLGREIAPVERAAILADPALRLRSPRLVAQMAQAEPPVASAAIRAARLGEDQWLDLIPALPVGARGLARHRRDLGPRVDALLERLGIADRGLPPADMAQAPAAEAPPAPDPAPEPAPPARDQVSGIGEIVRRIEEFRKTRHPEPASHTDEGNRLPLGDVITPAREALTAFDFATDVEGRITWCDARVAPMAIGLRLAAHDPDSPAQSAPAVVEGFRRRQPLRGGIVAIAGAPAIAGDWEISAAPRFAQPGGHFTGYLGRLRRPAPAPAEALATPAESDRMRQVLHELRTPVNAIQGFAEVIQQQLFGPAPHEYRALAASVASDAARILAGLEELDRLVKIDSSALELDEGACDIGDVVRAIVGQISAHTASRQSGFAAEFAEGPLPVALARGDAERLAWRLLATLAGEAAPCEQLRLRLRLRDGKARLTVRLPASLADKDDAALFLAAAPQHPRALGGGMFGTGFALRLAAAEARAAGGRLERREAKLRLELPLLGSAAGAAPLRA